MGKTKTSAEISRPLTADAPLTFSLVLKQTAAALKHAGIATAAQEAVWLLEHVTGMSHTALLAAADRALTAVQNRRLASLVQARANRHPLQYLFGEVEFAGTMLTVTPDVLIPRPETEELVGLALRQLDGRNKPLACADLGTGSGCIAIAMAHALPHARWWACDRSARALAVARRNAKENNVADRIRFYRGNWFDAMPKTATFDVVLANPPYVADGTPLEPELYHEPAAALFAAEDGLAAYRSILSALKKRLKPHGIFIGEIGLGQGAALRAIAALHGMPDSEVMPDLSGRERFLVIK